jgi:hypothetical protein
LVRIIDQLWAINPSNAGYRIRINPRLCRFFESSGDTAEHTVSDLMFVVMIDPSGPARLIVDVEETPRGKLRGPIGHFLFSIVDQETNSL